MKELGGYFGLEQLVNNEYYKDLLALNTGRNVLLFLIKAKRIRKMYIPYYLCDSISNMLKMQGCPYEYYHIDEDFMPIFDKNIKDSEFLYIVNYYGQLTDDKIMVLKQSHKNIILDNVQAFFQKPLIGMDTIYSCRKFFGVPDGAYLSTGAVLNESLECDISKNRMVHILGRFEGIASDYYGYFQYNDKSFKNEPLKWMSKLTKNILGAIDYEKVKSIRNENYAYLDSFFGNNNRLRLTMPNGPFAYPLYIDNGIEIRRKLAAKNIYIPTLWPNVIENNSEDSIEFDYAANILPLPCDQRYGVEDMEYLFREVLKCIS